MSGQDYSSISVYNNNIFGTQLIFFRANPQQVTDLGMFIKFTNDDSKINAIENIFIVPESYFSIADLVQHQITRAGNTISYYTYPWSEGAKKVTFSVSKLLSFSDYTPKNKKCFCYPTNYMTISNGIGNSILYKYEDFKSGSCTFEVQMSLGVGMSIILIPTNYKCRQSNSSFKNYDEQMPLAKFPTCSWSGDAYTNWLTQNAVNIPTQITGALTGAGTSAFNSANAKSETSQVGGAITGGANLALSIGNLIGQFYQASLLPNTSNGQNCADVNFSERNNNLIIWKMRARLEDLKKVDDYFTRFGYKILHVKVPELHSRLYWNYIEIGTGEHFAHGDVPQNDLDVIDSIAQRGFTVWHSHDAIGNFSLTNSIIV